MKASIIIRCYNEGQHLDRLLKGIEGQTYKDHEVIIVDSESTDNTNEILKNYDVVYKKIKKSDFTFGYALNVGCKLATGDIFVMVSAHVYPQNKLWLEEILRPFSDEKIAIVYGKQRGDHRNRYSEHMIFRAWFPDVNDREDTNPFCNNANCAIRKEHWQAYPYDAKISGLEDLDAAIQLIKHGYHVRYNPGSCIIHVHEEKVGQIYHRYYREAQALKVIVPSIKYSVFDLTTNIFVNITADIVQAFKDRVFFKNVVSIVVMRFLQFYGTYKGHKSPTVKQTNLISFCCSNKNTVILKRIFYSPPKIRS